MLEKNDVKVYYDKFGEKQDWQGFYENKAIDILIEHSDFQNAKNIFEFGCGTGKFAKKIIENETPQDCEYRGIDISETMGELALQRLNPFSSRAKIQITDGSTKFDFENQAFDRFISNYVLDILNEREIEQIFLEANRILKKQGLFSIISLTCGENFISRGVSNIWQKIYELRPTLVGGCRPLHLTKFVNGQIWEVKHHSKVSSFGITSEVLVLSK